MRAVLHFPRNFVWSRNAPAIDTDRNVTAPRTSQCINPPFHKILPHGDRPCRGMGGKEVVGGQRQEVDRVCREWDAPR